MLNELLREKQISRSHRDLNKYVGTTYFINKAIWVPPVGTLMK